jgi:hypothetical protein
MAAPNIVNVSSIIGVTTAVGLTTTAVTTFLSNAASSNKVFKINTIIASNIDGVNNADITVKYHLAAAGAGTSIALANTITIPADASLVIIGKDNPIYVEENRSLTAQASAENDIAIVCSYEEIS